MKRDNRKIGFGLNKVDCPKCGAENPKWKDYYKSGEDLGKNQTTPMQNLMKKIFTL